MSPQLSVGQSEGNEKDQEGQTKELRGGRREDHAHCSGMEGITTITQKMTRMMKVQMDTGSNWIFDLFSRIEKSTKFSHKIK